ncbi:MAG: ABC transporter permease [Candidatus Omnitrophica bacterium]|nr:ABC transporter permease [Candidatus Omnitrophota bacterium]
MSYEGWLGLRYLFAKRRERFISIIALLSIGGVALGVAALIVVLAVMTGFDHDITEKLVGTNSHLMVEAPGGLRDAQEVMRRVSAMDHVVGVSAFVAGQAIAQSGDQSLGVVIRGIDVEREARVSKLPSYLVAGHLPTHEQEVAIGTELRSALRLGVGDRLRLVSPADGAVHELAVSGLFHSGLYDFDLMVAVVSIPKAQQIQRLGPLVTGVSVSVDDLERSVSIAKSLQQSLGPGFRVSTWMDRFSALYGALRVEKTVMFVILTLIIVVAALQIMSMLIMIVMEKTKDIGVLRALGATRGSIATLFFSQGCTIGIIGVCVGAGLGMALAARLNAILQWVELTWGMSLFPPSVYYLDQIPTLVKTGDVAAIVVATLALTMLAGTYAAVRAARLAPVDALRYE